MSTCAFIEKVQIGEDVDFCWLVAAFCLNIRFASLYWSVKVVLCSHQPLTIWIQILNYILIIYIHFYIFHIYFYPPPTLSTLLHPRQSFHFLRVFRPSHNYTCWCCLKKLWAWNNIFLISTTNTKYKIKIHCWNKKIVKLFPNICSPRWNIHL